MSPQRHVLIIHGLAETALWMSAVGAALASNGFYVHFLDYPSTTDTIEKLSENYLHKAVERLRSVERLDIVGHSMGAVMLRYYLHARGIPNLGRAVMLAPGNAGSRILTYLGRLPLYSALMGPAARQSADDEGCFACGLPPKLSADFGVIAGCLPLDPFAFLAAPEPNDGRVTVQSTRLQGMRDHLVVAASHETILFHPVAILQTICFLQTGKFVR